jgi:hypothetical protein
VDLSPTSLAELERKGAEAGRARRRASYLAQGLSPLQADMAEREFTERTAQKTRFDVNRTSGVYAMARRSLAR